MARCKIAETPEAICYLWGSIICIIFSIVSFAIASTNDFFLPVGIVLMLLGIISFLMFILRRRKPRSRRRLLCECCYRESYDERCDNCMTTMLCLQPPDSQRSNVNAQVRLNNVTGRSAVSVSTNHHHHQCTHQRRSSGSNNIDNQTVCDICRNSSLNSSRNSRSSNNAQIRNLQKSLRTLQREYQYLERYPDVILSLDASYSSMLRQEEILTAWVSRRSIPSHDDMKAMKKTLTRVKQDLRRALAIAESTNSQAQRTSIVSENIELGSITVPQPPPYSLNDPLSSCPTSQLHSSVIESNYNSSFNDNNSSIITTGTNNSVSIPAMISSSLPCDILQSSYSSASPCTVQPELNPPEDESDAPPTYEEAVSTTV